MQKHCSDVWKSNLSQENLKLVQEELESARGSTQLLCIAMLSVTQFRNKLASLGATLVRNYDSLT